MTAQSDIYQCDLPTLFKRVIATIAVAMASAGVCCAEESSQIRVGPDLDGIFASSQTACTSTESQEIAQRLSITNLPIIYDGRTGAIGNIGTSHVVGPLKSGIRTVGLIASYYSRSKRCDTYLLFSEPAKGNISTRSAYPKETFPSKAKSSEIEAFNQLLQHCKSKGRSAPSEFRDGDYVLVDGKPTRAEGLFDCSVAAKRNSSSTIVSFNKLKVVVSVFGDQITLRSQ